MLQFHCDISSSWYHLVSQLLYLNKLTTTVACSCTKDGWKVYQHCHSLGVVSGTFGRVVASKASGLQFESQPFTISTEHLFTVDYFLLTKPCQQDFLLPTISYIGYVVNVFDTAGFWKDENEEKEAVDEPINSLVDPIITLAYQTSSIATSQSIERGLRRRLRSNIDQKIFCPPPTIKQTNMGQLVPSNCHLSLCLFIFPCLLSLSFFVNYPCLSIFLSLPFFHTVLLSVINCQLTLSFPCQIVLYFYLYYFYVFYHCPSIGLFYFHFSVYSHWLTILHFSIYLTLFYLSNSFLSILYYLFFCLSLPFYIYIFLPLIFWPTCTSRGDHSFPLRFVIHVST